MAVTASLRCIYLSVRRVNGWRSNVAAVTSVAPRHQSQPDETEMMSRPNSAADLHINHGQRKADVTPVMDDVIDQEYTPGKVSDGSSLITLRSGSMKLCHV